MEIVTAATPDDPAADMALTGMLLRAVAAGSDPCVRVFVPGPTLAFGRLDEREPGFAAAAAAARRYGYVPLIRHAGGRAVAYDHGSLIVEALLDAGSFADGIERRFQWMTELLVAALAAVGVEVCVGRLPGEFCPGRFSLHAEGIKLAGVAQRATAGAALVTAAIAFTGGERLRAVLTEVEAALDFAWDPATAGSVDQLVYGLTLEHAQAAVVAELAAARLPSA